MTCIVGVETSKGVILGADAISTNGQNSENNIFGNKIFQIDKRIIIASSGSTRVRNLFQYHLKLEEQKVEQTDEDFLVNVFITSIIKVFDDFDLKKHDKDIWSSLLIGYNNKLYNVQTDFSLTRKDTKYDACGAGIEYALGSLYTSKKMGGLSPEERVLMALKASNKHSAMVIPPFKLIKMRKGVVTL